MDQNLFRTEKRKLWLLRIIAVFTALSFLLLLGMASAFYSALGSIRDMTAQVGALTEKLETMSGKVETAVDEITSATQGLSDVDWPALAGSVQDAAASAQNGMQTASDALTSIDLETLNQAIADLAQVVGPLAQFVSRFG